MSRSAVAEPQDPTPMEGDEPVQPAAAKASASAQNVRISMVDKMRDKFKAEKRVPVKIHNDGPVFVQVNGYSFLIRENERVEVPESVARLLDEAGYI